MVKSLTQLKKERDALIRMQKAKKSLDSLSKRKEIERKKIQAEIRALKNPGSVQARKALRTSAIKLGKFIKKRAKIVGDNLAEMERRERMQNRKAKKKVRRRR